MSRRSIASIALVALAGVVLIAVAPSPPRTGPRGIPVRYAEGMVHGFLDLHTADGKFLANGDLLQVPREGVIESRMVFHFPDSSFFEETVSFTQNGTFALRSYHLVQRGPAFAADLDAEFTIDGHYVVKSRAHKDGTEKVYRDTLSLPTDVANGLVIILLKNLARHDTQTVHLLAFTPKPRLIGLTLAPMGETKVLNGQRGATAVGFALKPQLGPFLAFFARLTGKMPPDSHVWIVTDEVPAFMRFEGPLYDGPVWRIDLSSPSWPH